MEKQKHGADYWAKYSKARVDTVKELPAQGWSLEAITKRMKKDEEFCRKCYIDGGRTSGAVYHADDTHWDFIH